MRVMHLEIVFRQNRNRYYMEEQENFAICLETHFALIGFS